jgi:hypothetical protein
VLFGESRRFPSSAASSMRSWPSQPDDRVVLAPRDDAAGAGDGVPLGRREPGELGAEPAKLRGSDLFPRSRRARMRVRGALSACGPRTGGPRPPRCPLPQRCPRTGGSPLGHRCSESLDIHEAEAGDERDRIVFHA